MGWRGKGRKEEVFRTLLIYRELEIYNFALFFFFQVQQAIHQEPESSELPHSRRGSFRKLWVGILTVSLIACLVAREVGT